MDETLEALRDLTYTGYQYLTDVVSGEGGAELVTTKFREALDAAAEILTQNQISIDPNEQDDDDAGCSCGCNCNKSPGDECPKLTRADQRARHQTPTPEQAERLEYLRGEIRAERISYGEIAELQGLALNIDPDDVELLQWADVQEFPE
jgi:hypothetical protein